LPPSEEAVLPAKALRIGGEVLLGEREEIPQRRDGKLVCLMVMRRIESMLRLQMGILVAVCALVMSMFGVAQAADTNSEMITEWEPWSAEIEGGIETEQDIIAYTDDLCFQRDYVRQALEIMGLTHTLYYADPAGFEAALQAGGWEIILVNHNLIHSVSNSWDEIHAALLAGAKVAVATYDADGSNDYSGFVDDLYMAIGADAVVADVAEPNDVHIWLPQRFVISLLTPIVGTVFDDPDTTMNCYIDDGDEMLVTDWLAAVQGWMPDYADEMGSTVNRNGDCGSVFMSWLPDNYWDDDNVNAWPDGAELWMNILEGFLTGATATETGTWGQVKSLYR
jgi:hypothetical protein